MNTNDQTVSQICEDLEATLVGVLAELHRGAERPRDFVEQIEAEAGLRETMRLIHGSLHSLSDGLTRLSGIIAQRCDATDAHAEEVASPESA
jgi:hypothetical protein